MPGMSDDTHPSPELLRRLREVATRQGLDPAMAEAMLDPSVLVHGHGSEGDGGADLPDLLERTARALAEHAPNATKPPESD